MAPPLPLQVPLGLLRRLTLTLTTLAPSQHRTYRQVSRPPLSPKLPIPSAYNPPPGHGSTTTSMPAYPPGAHAHYKQSNTGLYGGQRIRFGNKVSAKNEHKSRRAWHVNVHSKRLWSASLGCHVQTRVTTKVLRTIDKCGGLDNYLLGDKTARLRELGPWGWRLRWRVMQTPEVKERYRRERERLGLPPKGPAKKGEGEEPESLVTTYEGNKVEREVLMRETDAMLAGEREIAFGEEAQQEQEEEEGGKRQVFKTDLLPEKDDFMREARP